MTKKLFVILGNQLFDIKHIQKFKKDHIFFICEDIGLCTYEKHHKHKILFFLSAMRSFYDELVSHSFEVVYKKIDEDDATTEYMDKILDEVKIRNIKEVSVFEIEDKPFESKFIEKLEKSVSINFIKSPMFLSSREEFKIYLSEVKKPFMASFYKRQRIKYKILVDSDDKPVGGKWSFDEENRKKLPKEIELPKQYLFKQTSHTKELKVIIENKFKDHPGDLDTFWIGTTRKCAQLCLKNFVDKKLVLFGDYEDAVDKRDHILFHSALSPFINSGLITPNEILSLVDKKQNKVKLNSLEGYVRQIIGWREFMRGIYQNYEKDLSDKNFFNHQRNLKSSWYEGTTGLEPLDFSIKNSIKYGWTHHIERLMILANIMNLCEIHPKFVYTWFMEMFIDSSEWVMVPNVYGMGLFSDGGIFSTKPYICGSAYFLKMMDFKKGAWCDVMDGLYWQFIKKNKKFFLSNPRLSMMVRILDKMKEDRKEKIFAAANNFIEKNTNDN